MAHSESSLCTALMVVLVHFATACGTECRAPGSCAAAVTILVRDAEGAPVDAFTLRVTLDGASADLDCGGSGPKSAGGRLDAGPEVTVSCGASLFAVAGLADTGAALNVSIDTNQAGAFSGAVPYQSSLGGAPDQSGCDTSCPSGSGAITLRE